MTAAATEMPVVGKSFYALCKKCGTDRYNTVLALPTSNSAKLKCEVCGSQRTWKPEKVGGEKKKTPLRGAVAKAKERAESARSAAHNTEYETFSKTLEAAPTATYNMKVKFDNNTKLNHPKFGLGFIKAVQAEKIEVVFSDEVRSLVHNRR